MESLGTAIWALVTVGGPVLLAGVLVYGWMTWRRRNRERGRPAEGPEQNR